MAKLHCNSNSVHPLWHSNWKPARLPQRLCKCICIILDLVFIFHSLLCYYSPFLPMCTDNEFPLPDWFQRYGAVQTLSILRLCRESLWRQVCLVQFFSCCWVGGQRERWLLCCTVEEAAGFLLPIFPQFAWTDIVSTFTAPLSQAVRFSFWTRTVYWRCEIRLLRLLEHCSTFRIVVGLFFFLSRFNAASSVLCDNWLRYSKNCEVCVLIDTSLGEIGHKILGMKFLEWSFFGTFTVIT